MELSHLRALIALSETSNLARAGQKLHLSAPAVFAQIRHLEDELGAKIYLRARKLLVLTGAGKLLLRHAKLILTQHDLAVTAVRESKEVRRGLIRFGCSPHTSVRIAPHLLRAFITLCPEVEVENVVADRLRLLNDLREGRVDVALCTPVEDDPEFEILRLWRHEMLWLVSSTNPLAGKKSVSSQDLIDIPFILPCTPESREATLRKLRAHLGFTPKVIMNHNQAGAIVELLRLGVGMSLLSAPVKKSITSAGLASSSPIGGDAVKNSIVVSNFFAILTFLFQL